STVTTIAVFVPVIFISGLIGQIFVEFALTISFSLIASLFVALTVVPMLASRFLRTKPATVVKKRHESWLYRNYMKALKWSLKRRGLILTITIVLVGISGFTLYKTGTEFMPPTDEGFVSLPAELPNEARVEKTEQIVSKIEEMAKGYDEVDVVGSVTGGNLPSLSRGTSEQNEGEISGKLVELSERD